MGQVLPVHVSAWPATGLAAALRRGDLSAEEALDAVLRRADPAYRHLPRGARPREPPPVGPLAFKMT